MDKPKNRKSIRLENYDYSQFGGYFVTICTHEKRCIFGHILGEEMRLNEYGNIVSEVWNSIPSHFDNIEIDQFVVMPNHVHGIIFINKSNAVGTRHIDQSSVGAQHNENDVRAETLHSNNVGAWHAMPVLKRHELPVLENRELSTQKSHELPIRIFGKPIPSSLSTIVGSFKSAVSKSMHTHGYNDLKIWHRNYYEHIIRHEKELNEIRKYIANNPLKWAMDKENPHAS